MFGSVIRNYKNAGVRVSVTLCVQPSLEEKQFPPLFVQGGTGLEIHRLASAGYRELLRQAMKSTLPRKPGERFEEIAWRTAAFAIVELLPQLRGHSAGQVGFLVPYTCFIAEYLSSSFLASEERDVCISSDGEVFINSIAGLHTSSRTLGNYRA